MSYEEYLKKNPQFAARSQTKGNSFETPFTAQFLYVFGWILYAIVALVSVVQTIILAKAFIPGEHVLQLIAILLVAILALFPSLLFFALGDIIKYLNIISKK